MTGTARAEGRLDERDERIERLLREGPEATPFVELPGGEFVMGSGQRADEMPLRRVRVGPFAAALAPVTNAEFARFLEETDFEPSRYWADEHFASPDCPVVGVSWSAAVAYCEWLSEVVGRPCRLPTEAEREYAARGDVPDVLYPWGDEPWTDGVHALGSKGGDRPHPIGASEPNAFGLYHMADNVHEWCSDWYAPYEPPAGPGAVLVDPRGPAEGTRRASRGGSWRHQVKVTRIAARSSLSPDFEYNDYGMRVYADAL
ncbi:MAG: formylglycine-generating enzyme family protein [Dehalococcoidia bacterium]|nr:formylglycine-generating enzyme family protein [Dehalococcoidia bacterium]